MNLLVWTAPSRRTWMQILASSLDLALKIRGDSKGDHNPIVGDVLSVPLTASRAHCVDTPSAKHFRTK